MPVIAVLSSNTKSMESVLKSIGGKNSAQSKAVLLGKGVSNGSKVIPYRLRTLYDVSFATI